MQLPADWRERAARRLGPWVLGLDRPTLRADAQAGLLGALVVLPQGIAFAALAGLPPAWGLYTSIVPCIVAALAGSSRLLVSGPTNVTALALAAMLAPLATADSPNHLLLAVAITLGVGLLQTALGAFRLGALTDFIAPSVMLGFMTGAAVLIASHAVGEMVASPQAAAVGALTVTVALLAKRWLPAGQHMLLALVVGGLAAAGMGMYGVNVMLAGEMPSALPKLSPPSLGWSEIKRVAGISLALSIIALGQTVAIAKALAARHGEHFDPNRECLGQGMSNITGAFFSCMVSSGSLNRTALSEQSGARTPMAAVFSALMVIVLLAAASPVLAHIPLATIAGLLLIVAWGLLDRPQWKRVLHMDRTEAAIAAGTLVATLTMALETAVLGGVMASLITYLYRSARPAMRTMGFDTPPGQERLRPFKTIDDAPDDFLPECPQLKMLRVEGALFFGAVPYVAERLHTLRIAPDAPRHLLVMCKSMSSIDLAGADLWDREHRLRLAMGGDLYFNRPRQQVSETWYRSGFNARLGHNHVFNSKDEALRTIVPTLDDGICTNCSARIFEECAQRPGAPVPVASG